MQIALMVATRSTCLRRQVGAVIVKEKRILTTGYNGAPSGLPHCEEVGCLREKMGIPSGQRQEICRGLHAEQNAIIQAALYGIKIKDSVMYCTHQPCLTCSKMIINAGIKKIFFKEDKVKTQQIEENLSKISSVIDFLNQFEEKKFDLGLFPNKILVKKDEYLKWIKEFKWEEVYRKCADIEDKMEKLKGEKQALQEKSHLLLPWKNLSISLKKLRRRKWIDYQLAVLPSSMISDLQKRAQKEEMYLELVSQSNKNSYLIILFLKENKAKMEDILQQLKGEKIQLKEVDIPSEELSKIKERTLEINEELKKNLKEARKINREKIKLMAIYDYFLNLLEKKKASSQSRLSNYTFALKGWIKKDNLPILQKGLKGISPLEIIVQPPKKGEKKIPVTLSNKPLFKPFELVTELYGLPHYLEIDPTPFLAPFFALFLGLCLTDGGYGILLALIAYIVPKKIQVGEGGKKLFSILFFSGLVTIGVGIITGGIFGFELSQLPSFLAPVKKLVLFNPMKNPMTFLIIALGIGIVHLLLGIFLEFWDDLRRGDMQSAILDHLSWIILILGIIIFGIVWVKHLGGAFKYISLGMILFGVGTLFLFSGRKSKNLFIRFAKGGYELYGLLSLFGDVLSYSRLLALGLATSVIATVVNTIAKMAWGIPLIGPVAMVLILILGHFGNLAINCLSGFIHTARLQFVEFFGKFYEGGGKEFKPLKEEGKYLIIK